MLLNRTQWSRSIIFTNYRFPGFRRLYSLDYLISALEKTENENVQPNSNLKKKKTDLKKLPPKDITRLLIKPSKLNDIFRHDFYLKPTQRNIDITQSIFKNSKFELEWTFDKYSDIPDIKYEILKSARNESLSKLETRTEYHESSLRSKKTFGINPNLLKPLPEVLLLGHTNSGKSSLINTLFLKKRDAMNDDYSEYAYVSKRAGYTKTLNCYNVGNKLRVIDSPGYGMFGEERQGEVVLEYISRRKFLRRVFIIIDGMRGFQEEDINIINHLVNEGVPFEIVFTKVDQVLNKFAPKKLLSESKQSKGDVKKRLENGNLVEKCNQNIVKYFNDMIDTVRLRDLATLPKFLFNNSVLDAYTTRRYGYKEIRYCILESCGLLSENSPIINLQENSSNENKKRRKASVKYLTF